MESPSTTANNANNRAQETANRAHDTVDKFASKAAAGAEKASNVADRAVETATGAAHRFVDTAAENANNAATWLDAKRQALMESQSALADSAADTIRSRPLSSVGSAFAIGFLLALLIGRR